MSGSWQPSERELCRGIVALFKSTEENTNDDRYLSILEDNNFLGILVPTLSFQFQTENLRKCLNQPEKYSGMILTSPRSAESVKTAVTDLPGVWQDNKRHYCVGIKTADTAATLLGLKNLSGQDCGNAENLGSFIVQEFQKGYLPLPLLFPCSSLKMDTLPRALAQHDVLIDTVISYVTVPHPMLKDFVIQLSQKAPNFLVFFSPSGVNFSLPFIRELGLIDNAKIISIGNTTARALEDSEICVSQVCEKPTPENLIAAITSLS